MADILVLICTADRVASVPQHLGSADNQSPFRVVRIMCSIVDPAGQVVGLTDGQPPDAGVACQRIGLPASPLYKHHISPFRDSAVVGEWTCSGVNPGSGIIIGRPSDDSAVSGDIAWIHGERVGLESEIDNI